MRTDGKLVAIIFLTLALMVAVGALGMTVGKYNALVKKLDDPQALSAVQSERILASVGKLMDLPDGEAPSIATVNDVSQLSNQSFFVHAQNGNKLIIYKDAHIAILFDMKAQKIVNVGSFSGDTSSSGSGTVAGIETGR